MFCANSSNGDYVYGTCWNEDVRVLVINLYVCSLDHGFNFFFEGDVCRYQQCRCQYVTCDVSYTVWECLFKVNIWLWWFWWMNNCVFEKVNFFFECLVFCPDVYVCWYGIMICGDIDWRDGWYFMSRELIFCMRSALISYFFLFNCCIKL